MGTGRGVLTTQAGDLDLKIPKVRSGSFFPSLLERRRRIDRALFAVVMEAYVHGVSTRSVDDLVKALGADSGISKSEVSRICGELDEELTAFKQRPLEHTVFPYVFLDATYCKARVNHRIASQTVVIATGISATGHREILGVMVGDSESKPFWTKFLRSLRARGLENVQLDVSPMIVGSAVRFTLPSAVTPAGGSFDGAPWTAESAGLPGAVRGRRCVRVRRNRGRRSGYVHFFRHGIPSSMRRGSGHGFPEGATSLTRMARHHFNSGWN